MAGIEKLRIVVVDDNVDATEAMVELLNADGFETHAAGEATTALGLIQRHLPHCVILDIDMPGIDGVELARHLRANYGQSLMLIALSGWDARHASVREIADIVDHTLSKPCDYGRLFDWLDSMRTPRAASR